MLPSSSVTKGQHLLTYQGLINKTCFTNPNVSKYTNVNFYTNLVQFKLFLHSSVVLNRYLQVFHQTKHKQIGHLSHHVWFFSSYSETKTYHLPSYHHQSRVLQTIQHKSCFWQMSSNSLPDPVIDTVHHVWSSCQMVHLWTAAKAITILMIACSFDWIHFANVRCILELFIVTDKIIVFKSLYRFLYNDTFVIYIYIYIYLFFLFIYNFSLQKMFINIIFGFIWP